MKTPLLISLLLVLTPIFSNASSADELATDTIIVKFGNNSQLVIYVDNQDDLKALEDYDINQMISELNMSIESSDDDVEYLTIEDESGTRYLKDTSIAVNERRTDINIDFPNLNVTVQDEDDDFYDRDFDDDDDFDFNFDRTRHDLNFEIGMNNWLEDGKFPDQNDRLYAIKPWGSWYVAINSVNRTHLGGVFVLQWGGGISWYNWKMENRSVRINKTPTGVVFSEDPVLEGTKSKLAATYLNVNIVPTLDFGNRVRKSRKLDNGRVRITRYRNRGVRLGLGGYAGYRIDSWTKFVYNDADGDKKKDKEGGNFFLNNFRYGVRGEFGFNDVDFFVNYDLNTVFNTGKGPNLHAISFGIII